MSLRTALRSGPFTTAIFAVLLTLGYILSHAPFLRLLSEFDVTVTSHPWLSNAVIAFYVPVEEYLIDRTMLDGPLLAWADLWQMGDAFRTDRHHRTSPFWKSIREEITKERLRSEPDSVSEWAEKNFLRY